MNEPNAQGQQPGAEIPAPENTQTQDPQAPQGGVQGRIDELTREKYEERRGREEAERRAQEAEVQRQQLVLLLSQQAAAQAQQARPTPEELDPEQQKLIAAIESRFAPTIQNLQKQNAQLAQQLGLTTIQTQVQGDQSVKQRAGEIAQNLAARGLIGQFSADDIQLMAEASLHKEARARAHNKGAPAPGLLTNATPAPRVQSPPANPQAVPHDIDRWPLDQQLDYWTKRVGDRPF